MAPKTLGENARRFRQWRETGRWNISLSFTNRIKKNKEDRRIGE